MISSSVWLLDAGLTFSSHSSRNCLHQSEILAFGTWYSAARLFKEHPPNIWRRTIFFLNYESQVVCGIMMISLICCKYISLATGIKFKNATGILAARRASVLRTSIIYAPLQSAGGFISVGDPLPPLRLISCPQPWEVDASLTELKR